MGSDLRKACTSKNFEQENHDKLHFASCSMRGWRPFMQDAHIANYPLQGNEDMGLFAIFDGHGGPEVSIFAKQHFTKCLITNSYYYAKDYENALIEAFIHLDEMMRTNDGKQEIQKIRAAQVQAKNALPYEGETIAGSTALVVLITKQIIYCANAGDSRCVVSVKTSKNKYDAKQLNVEHKPELIRQRQRIVAAGGRVTQQGRINDNLNLSRALGDFTFKANPQLSIKQQIIISVPDVYRIDRKTVQFIIMGCDGIWQSKPSYKMVKWIKNKIVDHNSLSKILSKLFDEEVSSGIGNDERGMDNMTALLILLKD